VTGRTTGRGEDRVEARPARPGRSEGSAEASPPDLDCQLDDDLHDLFGDARPAPAGDDEAAARLAIERALSALRGADARARVLRWAIERFGVDSTPAPQEPPPSQPGTSGQNRPDTTVSVDDLADLFDAPGEIGGKKRS